MMLDLDFFKAINDTFGHDAGDHVLKKVALALVGNVRSEDIVCRFGGEEFVIVSVNGKYEDYLDRAWNLRGVIKALKIKTVNDESIPVTVSIGVASFPSHGQIFDEILKAADQALYAAKERGRDQVIGWSEI